MPHLDTEVPTLIVVMEEQTAPIALEEKHQVDGEPAQGVVVMAEPLKGKAPVETLVENPIVVMGENPIVATEENRTVAMGENPTVVMVETPTVAMEVLEALKTPVRAIITARVKTTVKATTIATARAKITVKAITIAKARAKITAKATTIAKVITTAKARAKTIVKATIIAKVIIIARANTAAKALTVPINVLQMPQLGHLPL